MGWFSRTADESAMKADRLRDRADRELAKGSVSLAIQLGVKASKAERDNEETDSKPWWW